MRFRKKDALEAVGEALFYCDIEIRLESSSIEIIQTVNGIPQKDMKRSGVKSNPTSHPKKAK